MELTGLPAISAPLPWHQQAWKRLHQQLQQGQLPHALLLTGVRATGKARLALALARLLLCEAPSGGLNCGQCHPCELSANGSHGDFRWLQPEEKARVIKIDQVRDLVAFVTKTASFGRRKVVVLSPADSMNTNAANALLKSLEEPTPDTYLVLVCHQLHGVPATIRSRCQILQLPTPAEEESLAWLEQLCGERGESQRLLQLAAGLPLLAEAIYSQAEGEELVKVRLALEGLVQGRLGVAETSRLLLDAPLEELLEQALATLQGRARALQGNALRSPGGRAVFALMDEVTALLRAVRAGANPNRQLLAESIVGKVHSVLGTGAASGSIEA
jgi:DNA polymerase-3 subunit delta'